MHKGDHIDEGASTVDTRGPTPTDTEDSLASAEGPLADSALASAFTSPPDDEPSTDDDPSDGSSTVRSILQKAAPQAARTLAQVARASEKDKDRVVAAEAILNRTGFPASGATAGSGPLAALNPQVLIAALLGLGKVMGVQEASGLQAIDPHLIDVTPLPTKEVPLDAHDPSSTPMAAPVRRRSPSPKAEVAVHPPRPRRAKGANR